MLTRQDCYKILFEMSNKGLNVQKQISTLSTSTKVPIELIRFINQNRELNVTTFYESLRKKHNAKSSKLYLKLMKEEIEATECLKTLSSYITQVLIMSESIDTGERKSFYNSVRIKEALSALNKYFLEQDITECIDILKMIKSDIKILENKE